jgi:tetratricopeptide (TPR) repeat protein
MGSADVSLDPAPPRPKRRRWYGRLVRVGLLLVVLIAAGVGWQVWQEHAARKALADDRLEEAQKYCRRALWLRPHAAATTLLAARIYRLRGAFAEAEQYLSICGEHNGMSEPLQLEWMLLRCQRGEVDELSSSLLSLVQRGHSESPAILEALASVYMWQTRYPQALSCLNRWLELSPSSVRALSWRGWINYQLDHMDIAVSDYEQALEIQPDHTDVRLRLVEILVESQRYPRALPHLERLHRELPDNPDIQVNLGRCRAAQAPDEADALLDEVLAGHPDHFQALLEKGRLQLSRGQPDQAEPWLRKALGVDPHSLEARFALHRSLQGQPEREQEAQKELARWEKERKDRETLTHLLRYEVGAQPNNPDLAAQTGILMLELGEEQKGFFWLGRALAINPRHARSRQALIAYYERTSQPEKAAEQRQFLAESKAEP